MGSMWVALIAGRRLASSAMPVPTVRLTTIVRVAKTRPVSGRSTPVAVGLDLRGRRQEGPDLARELGLGAAGLRAEADHVELAAVVEQGAWGRKVEGRDRDPADLGLVAEPDGADHAVLLDRAVGER